MRRDESLISLSKEHHAILIAAQVLKLDAPEYPSLPTDILGRLNYAHNMYKDVMKPHIEREEHVLFPIIEGLSPEIDQLIYILKDDHTEIDVLFTKLEGESNQTWLMDELGKLIDQHVRMEERELFELIQSEASEEMLLKIKSSLSDHK